MNPHDDLKAFLDGELPAERMAEMRETIERDLALAEEAAEIARISTTIRTAAAQPAAVGLEETLRLLERSERTPIWRRWMAPLTVAVAAVALIVGAPKLLSSADSAQEFARSETAVTGALHKDSQSASVMSAPTADVDAAGSAPNAAAAERAPAAPKLQAPSAGTRFRAVKPRSKGASSLRYERDRSVRGPIVEKGAQLNDMPQRTTASPIAKEARAEKREVESVPSVPPGDVTSGIQIKLKESQDEPVVVEVDSPEDAEAAIRDLAFRMGGLVNPPEVTTLGAVAKSRAQTQDSKVRDLKEQERRLVLEVDEDRLDEARKKVPDVVREDKARRDAIQNRVPSANLRAGQGGPGGAPGAPAGGSQGAGQFANPRAGFDGANNRGGFGAGRGGAYGGVGGGGGYGGATRNADADTRRATGNRNGSEAANNLKVRRRLQIVLKFRPKPAGKIEE